MSKVLACIKCFAPIEVPENYEFEKPYCNKCFEAEFGRPYMDFVENTAKEFNESDETNPSENK